MAKTRFTPQKIMTLSRQELCPATMSVRLEAIFDREPRLSVQLLMLLYSTNGSQPNQSDLL